MSRYVISEAGSGKEVVVGWDPPLGTFFAQEFVEPENEDDDDCVWWVGYTPRELPTIGSIRAILLTRGIIIPPEIDAMLIADFEAPWQPGPLQNRLGFTGKGE